MSVQQNFINMMLPLAQKAAAQTGLDPRLIVAQAALETGWGQHAPGNNYFGIKSHGQPGGNVLPTQEVRNGQATTENASFRAYGGPEESVQGYMDFLTSNPRYQPMLEAEGLEAQIAALGESGYATDPNYTKKVRGLALRMPEQRVAQAGMQPVTDPDLLRRLEGEAQTPDGMQPVTDPELIKMLEGAPSEGGPAPAPTEIGEETTLEEGERRSQPPTFWGGILDSIMNGITLGYGDEVRALDAAVMGETPEGEYFDYSRPFWERYDVAKAAEEKQRKAFKEERPVTSTVAEIGGAVATGGGLARQGATLMGRGGSVAKNVGLGAAEGAAYGGVYGSGEAPEGRRLEGFAQGAGMGALTGGAVTLGAQKFAQALARRGAIKAAPSREALRGRAGAAAETARAQGIVYNGHSYDTFFRRISNDLADEGLDETLTPATARTLVRLESLLGKQPTFDDLERMRRVAAMAAQSQAPADRRLASMLVDRIDEFVATPQNVASATGDAALASASLSEMRRNWSRMKRAEMLDEALERAERRAASTGSGGNVENAIRQNVRAILDNPKKRRGFSKEEIAALEDVVRGGSVRHALRLLGKIAPGGNGLSLFLNLGGIYMEPSFLAATLAGTGAKWLAERGTQQAAQRAGAMIRSGANMPGVPALPAPAQSIPLGAGGYAGGLMGQTLEDLKVPVR